MKTFLAILLLFTCCSASADDDTHYSEDSLTVLYSEFHYLHDIGLKIHTQYDAKIKADPIQMRYCLGEYSYIEQRAKAAIGMANRLDSPHKEEYIQTGWKALECVMCKGKVSACDAIPPTLKTMTAEYKASKKQ